jgi:hypothetical protein
MSDDLTLCWFGDSIDLLDPFPTCFVPWKLLVSLGVDFVSL